MRPNPYVDSAYGDPNADVRRFERGGFAGRIMFWVGMVLGPIVLLAFAALGVGYFRLSQGPITLSFLAEPIEQGIGAELSGLTPKISGVVVAFNEDYGLEFQLQELKLTDSNGSVVASAPSAAVELSHAALWSGKVVPSRVELIEPRLFLFYSQKAGLSLSFSTPTGPPKLIGKPEIAERRDPRDGPPAEAEPVVVSNQGLSPPQRIDLARILSEASVKARSGDNASGHLKEFGLRDATLVLDYEGQRSVWQVPSYAIDVEHRQERSIITGSGRIASPKGPWTMTFRAEAQEFSKTVGIKASVRGLVPQTIAPAFPELSALQAVEFPVGGDVTIALTADGEILTADLDLAVSRGRLVLPSNKAAPLDIAAGRMILKYDAAKGVLELRPSALRTGGSQLQVFGSMTSKTEPGGMRSWPFEIKATDGWLASGNVTERPVAIEEWQAKGRMLPDKGTLHIDNFAIQAAGGRLDVQGVFDLTAEASSSRIIGKFSPMSLRAAKALWPSSIAVDAREWVDDRVQSAVISSGQFSFYDGRYFSEAQPDASEKGERLSVAMEFADVKFVPMPGTFPIVAPRALMRLENNTLEVVTPEAEVVVDTTQRFPLKAGRFTAVNLDAAVPRAEVAFNGRGAVDPFLRILDAPPINMFREEGKRPTGLTGKIDGKVKILFPLLKNLDFASVGIDGEFKLTNGRAKGLFGHRDVHGASINFDVTHQTLEAKGNMLIGGVPADISWQRIFAAPIDKQPPVRINATLDNADRKQLGMEVGDFVDGDVPVELTIVRGPGSEKKFKLRADLSNAEIKVSGIGWRKRPGRQMLIDADIGEGPAGRTELQNFTVRGDKIAVEGWIAMDKKGTVTEFFFPVVTLDVVTQLKAQGRKRSDGIWKLQIEGPTFNGQGFFSSLFSLGKGGQQAGGASGSKREGIDLVAKINTVIGFSDQTLRRLDVKMSRRGGRLTALDAKGTLESDKPLYVKLVDIDGAKRQLRADSTDAGRAFKLVGFYPNVQGGRVRLEVNLDGRGAAEQTGVLWVERFRILSDPIVSEVVEGGKGNRGSKGRRREVREVYDFDRMKAPFSVGHDQFVLKDSYLRGPLIGASIRGKVDYRARQVQLGGTYIPLQGLNNALGEIPLLGQLLSGPRGEGIFGITFAINGAMSNPQVLVNPLSLVTPGIFREIFQTTPNNPTVKPRAPRRQQGTSKRVRSSSAPATGGGARRAPVGAKAQGTIDGWSSQTRGNP